MSSGGVKFWPTTWVRHFRLHCLGVWPLRYIRPAVLPHDAQIVTFPGGSCDPADVCAGHMTGFEKPGRPLVHLRQTIFSRSAAVREIRPDQELHAPRALGCRALARVTAPSSFPTVSTSRLRVHECTQRSTHHLHEVGHQVRPGVRGSALCDGAPPFGGRFPVHLPDG